MPFPQAPAVSSVNTRRMAAIRLALVLWEVMLVVFSTLGPNEVVQLVQVGEEGNERRVQSRSTPSEAKPGSLWTCGRRRVLLPHPGSATGHLIAPRDHHTLQHIQIHFVIDFQADFEDVMRHDVAPQLKTTPKTITVAGNFVFITLGTSLLFVAIQIAF